jgi:uncharacterized protein (TIGR02466 family)
MNEQPQDGQPARLQRVSSLPAFATYIDEYLIPDHAALNHRLLEDIDRWRKASDGISVSNHQGWHSTRTFFDRKEAAIVDLARHIRTGLAHSVKRYWAAFDPTRHPVTCEGWANVNGTGAFNSPHTHEQAHFSGSYYVSVPSSEDEASGALEFLNPSSGDWLKLPDGSYMIRPTIFVKPKPGSMFIFPSYLRHWVYPNQEEADRVSIAFNLRLSDIPAP